MSDQSPQCSAQGLPCLEALYAEEWAVDALDRLLSGDSRGAKTSFSYASMNIMKLPPGSSYEALEAFLACIGVKVHHTPEQNSPV